MRGPRVPCPPALLCFIAVSLSLCSEYRPRPHLDRYDERGLDERDYAPIAQDARAAAEAELAARDRARSRARLPAALRDEEDESEESFRAQRRRRMEDSAIGLEEGDVDDEVPFNLEAFDVPVKDWLRQEPTRAEVKRRFVRCLVCVSVCVPA